MQNSDELLRALLANAQSREAPASAPKKRKRGGLAGLWDRNKKIIKPVVSAGLGMIPGIGIPLAAGAGALMGGLDREGKGGIGFDVGKGAMGGLAGAAAGGAGRFLGGKMGIQYGKPMLGSGAGAASVPPAPPQPELVGQLASADSGQSGQMVANMVQQGGPLPPAGRMAATGLPSSVSASPAAWKPHATPPLSASGWQDGGGGGLMGALRGAGRFARDNANAVGMGLQGVSGIMGAQSERRIAEDKMAFEREREEEDRRRRAMIAQMLLPMYQQERGRMGL